MKKRTGAGKKIYSVTGVLLALALLSGCGGEAQSRPDESGKPVAQDNQDSQGGRDGGTAALQSYRIYHSDAEAMNLVVSTVRAEKVSPEFLLMNLALYDMLPAETKVKSFAIEENEEETLVVLDLSAEFSEKLASMGTSGEYMMLGSLVNTFLDAYGADAVRLTCEGKTPETGHAVYEEPLTAYHYQWASYAVSTGEVISGSEEEGRAEISYPVIENLTDTELQEKWNRIMEEQARAVAERVQPGEVCRVNYEIMTMDDELLSVLCRGTCGKEDGVSDPSVICYTYNIDMRTGESLRLAYYEDVEALAEKLLLGEGYRVPDIGEPDFHERIAILYGDAGQLAEVLRGYDYSGGTEKAPGYSYRKDGVTRLCMEVPRSLGGYVEILLEEK